MTTHLTVKQASLIAHESHYKLRKRAERSGLKPETNEKGELVYHVAAFLLPKDLLETLAKRDKANGKNS